MNYADVALCNSQFFIYGLIEYLDPIYTGLVTTVQVLYLLEICCRGWVFIILYDEI